MSTTTSARSGRRPDLRGRRPRSPGRAVRGGPQRPHRRGRLRGPAQPGDRNGDQRAEGALENNTDGDDIDVQCASIDLVKTAGNAADGTILTIPVPGSVTFTYVVTNTGTADLEDIALVDDNATPANTADDVTIICPSTSLEAGDSMTCTATLPVTGTGITRTNVATVTATPDLDYEAEVSATDDAVVKVPAPVVTPRPTPRSPRPHQHPRRGYPGRARQRPPACVQCRRGGARQACTRPVPPCDVPDGRGTRPLSGRRRQPRRRSGRGGGRHDGDRIRGCSHCPPGHAEILARAGAVAVIGEMADLTLAVAERHPAAR